MFATPVAGGRVHHQMSYGNTVAGTQAWGCDHLTLPIGFQ
jgi:hypothetical protein